MKNILLETLFADDTKNTEAEPSEFAEAEEALPLLTDYEVRKKETAYSNEPIEGVFYLYNDRIIPDYYSECLRSDRNNPIRNEMYHLKFYKNYMKRKFEDIYGSEFTPRGRITYNMISIDACYANDIDIIKKLIDLYRLPEKDVQIKISKDYRCSNCWNSFTQK